MVALPRAMESPMPSSKRKSRSQKSARPAADATCTVARTVGSLTLWSCSDPAPAQTPPPPEEFVKRIGRYRWRFFFITLAEARAEDALLTEPGWYVEAANPNPEWICNEPQGPYESFYELWVDTVQCLKETP
jgi:hypothetical protein